MSETTEGRKRGAFGGRGLPQGRAQHDPMGTVRRSPDGLWLAIRLPSPPSTLDWHVQDQRGAGGHEAAERIAHWPIVGAVPWSPAAGVPLDGTVMTPASMTRIAGPTVVGLPMRSGPPAQRVSVRPNPGGLPPTVQTTYPGTDAARVAGERL